MSHQLRCVQFGVLLLFILPSFASAVSILPAVIGGASEVTPYDGIADRLETTPFIANVNGRKWAALMEFDLTRVSAGVVDSATLTGRVAANNGAPSGTRIHIVEAYDGNGQIELGDYSAAGSHVDTFSHTAGGSTTFDLDVASILQDVLDAGGDYLGVRISPGANPQGFDVLTNFFEHEKPRLTYSISPPGATQVELEPHIDALATLSGGVFSIDATGFSINVQQVDFAGVDRRGIMEFDVSSIPANAEITSARLDLDVNAFTSSTNSFPKTRFYGYAGNGTAEVADTGQTGLAIGVSPPVMDLEPVSVELDPATIESLLGTSDFLGILALGSSNSEQLGWYATEAHQFGTPPMLALAYTVPEPVPGDYDGDNSVGVGDYAAWKAKFGSAAELAADGNGNGVIDAADYTIWRDLLSSGSAAGAAVPEPSSMLLALVPVLLGLLAATAAEHRI